ncbi:MAG TPA: hypothetical protein DF613_08860 [Lachnospiraceae bacterium]|nr:hypothetical protein [Lachnospiraceae bacterium]
MKIHMYLPDADQTDRFAVTDENLHLLLLTAGDSPQWRRRITDPSGDAVLLNVRYASLSGESFVFSDITGTRGTYHLRRYSAVIRYHMLNGRREMQYHKADGAVTITRRGKKIATARLLPEYTAYFIADITEPSELLFVVGSLLAVSKELSTSRI